MGDPTGRRVVSHQQLDHIQRAVPRLARQLTGQPYRGRVESGIWDRTRRGWITVRFVTEEEDPDISKGCGRTRIGQDPGYIDINLDSRRCPFPKLFTHEFGHAMGFRHVEDRTAIMANSVWNGQSTFPREQYHAQLAFEVGRGHEYCGWPFQRKCATPKRGFRTVAPAHRPPIIVID